MRCIRITASDMLRVISAATAKLPSRERRIYGRARNFCCVIYCKEQNIFMEWIPCIFQQKADMRSGLCWILPKTAITNTISL